MQSNQTHADLIRSAFTAQVGYISTSPAFVSEERLKWLLDLVRLSGSAEELQELEMLDVACGAGVVAVPMAEHVRYVTGLDLTPAVIERAEELARERDAGNCKFVLGDAGDLPFPEESFDIVTCTSAFHHFDEPERIMAQMARVLKPGGALCALDITTSEVPPIRTLHQEMERLRDPSHITNLTPSTWRRMAQKAGLSVKLLGVLPSYRDLDEWMTICPTESRDRVRSLFEQDVVDGKSGLDVRRDGDAILFTHPMLLVRAEKIESEGGWK